MDSGQAADKRIEETVIIDLDKLERQAQDLYLTRFVEKIRQARGENGRFLVLRAGDRFAISAAPDGSGELLPDVIASPPSVS